jgi:hypothetical protein
MAAGLANLADALDRMVADKGSASEPMLLGEAAEAAKSLQHTIGEYLTKNRTTVIDTPFKIGAFGLGIALVHSLGVDSTVVDTLIAGIVTGVDKKIGRK